MYFNTQSLLCAPAFDFRTNLSKEFPEAYLVSSSSLHCAYARTERYLYSEASYNRDPTNICNFIISLTSKDLPSPISQKRLRSIVCSGALAKLH